MQQDKESRVRKHRGSPAESSAKMAHLHQLRESRPVGRPDLQEIF
jgi:hypothetical protein